LVVKAFDGNLFACVGDKVYSLDEILEHEQISRNFDFPTTDIKPKKRYIPPMSHPWRQVSFEKHLNAQTDRTEHAC